MASVFPSMVENVMILVEIDIELMVDIVAVEYTFIVLPDMVMNPMLLAVSVPLVLEVNVLMVEPVAVEKNKFCATKLLATYKSRLIDTLGAVTLIVFTLLMVDRLIVLTLIVSPDILINAILVAVN